MRGRGAPDCGRGGVRRCPPAGTRHVLITSRAPHGRDVGGRDVGGRRWERAQTRAARLLAWPCCGRGGVHLSSTVARRLRAGRCQTFYQRWREKMGARTNASSSPAGLALLRAGIIKPTVSQSLGEVSRAVQTLPAGCGRASLGITVITYVNHWVRWQTFYRGVKRFIEVSNVLSTLPAGTCRVLGSGGWSA